MGLRQISLDPGTVSILRANFAKGFYYNDEDSLLKVADTLVKFDQGGRMLDRLRAYRQNLAETEKLREQLAMARRGEAYVEISRLDEIRQEVVRLEASIGQMKTELINFIVSVMESKKLLAEPFTILRLKKLPLTLRGTRGVEAETEEEEMYEEEEY